MKRAHPARPAESSAASKPGSDLTEHACRLQALLDSPQSAVDKAEVLDVAYEEYCRRREAGQEVEADEFCRRFPYQSSLRRLLGVHLFLEQNPQLLADRRQLSWPAPGQEFSGFTLVRELGRGSFARVFLATEPALGGRTVAIKVSCQGASEALTLGRLDHPNIVPVHSVQHDPVTGFSAICMPYLGSATLCDVLDRVGADPGLRQSARVVVEAAGGAPGSGPSRRAGKGAYVDAIARIGCQLAEALAVAHSRGICHRDLKPSNVLLATDGRPMLLDFNLASDQQLPERRFGGTLPYMAPEQIQASDIAAAAGVDARSDIFSLGVILYELLTGVHPFAPLLVRGSMDEARGRLLEGQRHGPRPVAAGNPLVDRPLARLIARCLAFRPEERPQSAQELAAALRASLSWRGRTRRWLGRQRRLLMACALLLAAASGLLCYALAMRDPYALRERQAGIACYRAGKYPEALAHLNAALDNEPHSVEALLARGRVLQRLGDDTLAVRDYEAAAETASAGHAWAAAGYCLCRLENHERAAANFEHAVESGFGPAAVFNDLGYCYLHLGEIDKAQRTLDQAVALDATLQASYHNRALVTLQRALASPDADLGQALADIRRALEIGPAAADLHRHAAQILARAGFRDLALEHIRRAIDEGQDSQTLRDDVALQGLRADSWFQELLRRPRTRPTPSRSVRILDPIQD